MTKPWSAPPSITAEDLNNDGALSRTAQPALLHLVRELATAPRVTFVVGAGFSRDAGLPSWYQLIDTLIKGLMPTDGVDLGAIAKGDPDDLMRKAEHVIEMRLSQNNLGTTEELVRSALYKPGAVESPGPLFRSLAELTAALVGRVNVLTTNFDELLERSLTDVGVNPDVHLLESSQGWSTTQKASRDDGKVPVFHLHGRVRRLDSERTDSIVLTESHFMRHGRKVRGTVAEALRNSTTVFLGLSMTDPNLVGPLWDTRKHRRPSFVISVPESVEGFSADDARTYAVEKSRYMHSKLRVSPIFLKTYGQVEQLLQELHLGMKDPTKYEDRDVSGNAYDARLSRVLSFTYGKLGSQKSTEAPVDDQSRELQQRLAEQISPTGRLGAVLNELSKNRGTEKRLHALEQKHKSAPRSIEKFGLEVWLRAGYEGESDRTYGIRLVGSSDLSFYGDGRSATQIWPIENGSQNMACQAISFSRVKIWRTLPELSQGGKWKSVTASPYRITHRVDTVAGEHRIHMVVGAMCLLSSHHVKTEREDVPPGLPMSWISALDQKQRLKLSEVLHRVGQDLIR